LSLSSFLEVYSEDHLFYIVTWLIAQIVSNIKIYYIILHFSFISILIKVIKSSYANDVLFISRFLYFNYLFYYSYTFNALRQGIAMVILILAISYLIDKKGYKFFFSIAIAAFFHLTSVFFSLLLILFYFYKNFKLKYSIALYIFTSF